MLNRRSLPLSYHESDDVMSLLGLAGRGGRHSRLSISGMSAWVSFVSFAVFSSLASLSTLASLSALASFPRTASRLFRRIVGRPAIAVRLQGHFHFRMWRYALLYIHSMALDLQSLFGFHVHSCFHWLRETPQQHPPPHLGSYTRALLVTKDGRHCQDQTF